MCDIWDITPCCRNCKEMHKQIDSHKYGTCQENTNIYGAMMKAVVFDEDCCNKFKAIKSKSELQWESDYKQALKELDNV